MEEPLDRGLRRVEELGRRAEADDSPLVQQRDRVRELEGGRQVLGDQQQGHPELRAHELQLFGDDRGGDRVEPRGRVVAEQELRVLDHRARERGPLEHASGELAGQHLRRVGELEQLEDLPHPLVHLVRREVRALAQRERDVVEHAHRVEERPALEEDAELAVHPREPGLVELGEVLAVHLDHAAVGRRSIRARA